MPGYSGLELSRIISQNKLKTQVIIVSGYAEFSYAQKAIQYGVPGYCLKPVEYDVYYPLASISEHPLSIPNTLIFRIGPSQYGYLAAPPVDSSMLRNLSAQESVHGIGYQDTPITPAQLRTALYRCLAMAYQFFIDADCRLCCHYHDFASLPFMSRLQNALDFGDKLRIDTAKKLLTTTNSSINDVSIQAGFNDYFYFLKTFKKYTGKTPSEFRNEV